MGANVKVFVVNDEAPISFSEYPKKFPPKLKSPPELFTRQRPIFIPEQALLMPRRVSIFVISALVDVEKVWPIKIVLFPLLEVIKLKLV